MMATESRERAEVLKRLHNAYLVTGKTLLPSHEFYLEIMEERHKQQVIDIMGYQFSEYGGAIITRVFPITLQESLNAYYNCISHAIQCQTAYVIIDCKHNNVACFCIHFDFKDIPLNAEWNHFCKTKQNVGVNINRDFFFCVFL